MIFYTCITYKHKNNIYDKKLIDINLRNFKNEDDY